MIVKIIASKKGTGSFSGLSDYLKDKNNIHKDKVEMLYFENCEFDNFKDNIKFIESTQKLYKGKADPTMICYPNFRQKTLKIPS